MIFNNSTLPRCTSFQVIRGAFSCTQFHHFLFNYTPQLLRGASFSAEREAGKLELVEMRKAAIAGLCPFRDECPIYKEQLQTQQNKKVMSYSNNYQSGYSRGGYSRSGYSRGGGYGYGRSGYSRGGNYGRQRTSWPKGKKNSNSWVRIIDTEGGKAAIGGAWVYDFFKKALFKVDITPKYSRKDGNGGFESVSPSYETQDGRIRYKVKCAVTNKNTMQVFHDTGFYNPDSGKVYFERIDLLVNFNKRTACFNPFSKEYRPRGYYKK